jgi:hypothetical protein
MERRHETFQRFSLRLSAIVKPRRALCSPDVARMPQARSTLVASKWNAHFLRVAVRCTQTFNLSERRDTQLQLFGTQRNDERCRVGTTTKECTMPLLIPVLIGFPIVVGGGWVIYRIFT